MIETGIVELLQGTPAVVAIAAIGGFPTTLPKDQTLPSWTHSTVSEPLEYTLAGSVTARGRRMQIDCYGASGADVVRLGAAIDGVLDGFHGTLSDPDATFVQGIFRDRMLDFFDDARRTYRRMLEYIIWFEPI